MTTETQANLIEADADARPLLADMKKGDPVSCRPFIAHFERPLYNYLYWLTGDPAGAADLFQRAMAQVCDNLSRVRKAPSVKDWVFREATRICLEQAKRRQQQKRSSWDNILRSGVSASKDDKWTTWDDETPPEEEAAHGRNALLVDALKSLSLKERAAILLACVVGVHPTTLVESLNLSRRSAERMLLVAYDRLALSVRDPKFPAPTAPKGLRDNIRRQLLNRLSPGRQRKLDATVNAAEGGSALRTAEEASLASIRHLPAVAPPTSLADDTEAHLRADHEAQEDRIATWGFRFMQVTVPIFIVAIITIILLPTVSRSMEAARLAAASENLKAIGEALLAYSAQSEGNRLPPMVSDVAGVWVPDLRVLYPRFIKDPAQLVRPSLNDPELLGAMRTALNANPPDYVKAHDLMARSYVYTGYVLLDESALSAFKSAVESAEKPNLESDIDTADRMLRRLKRDVEYFFVENRSDPLAAANTRATIPIMFETAESTVFGRDPDGANVLYLDGHVDYVRFGSQFPVTVGVQAVIAGR
jgi:RNA polymerase sigma factor (sigma-70 family)